MYQTDLRQIFRTGGRAICQAFFQTLASVYAGHHHHARLLAVTLVCMSIRQLLKFSSLKLLWGKIFRPSVAVKGHNVRMFHK